MAHPKKRRTRRQRGNSRAHLALDEKEIQSCVKCKQPVLPHIACKVCGTYKNREVIKVS